MIKEEPKISVVIPTKGRPELLKRAIDSVLKQSFEQFEIIIVIDGEDPTTIKMLAEYKDTRLKKIINTTPQGGGEARNIGVRHAEGKWIAFLDDDDEFLPGKLEAQYNTVKASNYRYPISFCKIIGKAPKGEYIWPRRAIREKEHVGDYILARNSLFQGEGLIQTTMLFVPKDLLIEIPFEKDLKRHQEWDWVLRVNKHADVGFEYCDQVLAIWYIEENRNSISKQGSWEYSLEWIDGKYEYVSRRAYASFLMTVVSSIAAKEKDKSAIKRILKNAFSKGRPSFVDMILFCGIWGISQETRRNIRKFFHRK
ncbi:UDP-Glc:alpha-D-GlcNAc-diphosphoundecaprenol beta-1,3-glucosyltransferase WfgD [Bacillus mobilis]|uniref:UDP-Glc:alpha-D-GlcNAc-diphosphoundecaprenol beta-1,3-glucosyltransferase WfgD n=1 Tax=Bacillus mobilis TaxID=2026190 RepID=A0A1Y5YZ66_9BACI|nr:glycosyltransferase family 2 protein [Bacillus mobilis]SMD72695.1 UDP-Glc:alpha-D-GlcNAc-diphosphoundecaprenol beta-1,3-glucosyltransferase WfgD [Bacillus mobilis]